MNHYETSKYAMEHMARTYSVRLPIVIPLHFNYPGVGQTERFLVPKIVAHFRRRDPVIELGNVDIERDFSDVRDVARIYAKLVESGSAIGMTVNVGSGRSISLRSIVAKLEEFAGHRIEIRVNPAFVRSNDIARLAADTSRLDAAIGLNERVAFESTIAWMLD